jgi:diguanylate cyclase (GGDEF)-like protein/PAS domain S-box-containing protein
VAGGLGSSASGFGNLGSEPDKALSIKSKGPVVACFPFQAGISVRKSMAPLPDYQPASTHRWLHPSLFRIYGVLSVCFVLFGVWLAVDLQRGYEKVLADTSYRAMQRSEIISQSFRTQVLATDYVLRDVLGRIQESDIVYPDTNPDHVQRITLLLKEKAETVPYFFSMVVFDRDCVFTATATGKNTGVKSKPELCEARRMHSGPGPLASYVPGAKSASGRSVLVLSRHLTSPAGVFQGGVLGVIELERAQNWLDSLRLEPGDSVALLDDAQILLARHPLLAEAIEKRMATPEIPVALRSTTPGESIETQLDIDGRERLFGFSKIDGFPFTVAYGFDKAKALEEWQLRAAELTAGYFTLLLLALIAARHQWTILRQREELRSSEEHFRMLAENMADIVWRADAQMCFTYINTADQRLRGFSREEVIGTHLRDNLTLQGQDTLEEQHRTRRELEIAGNKGVPLKYELPMRHKNGGEVWVEMSSVPIYGSDGDINGYQGVGRDISKRRRHEAQLLQSHQQLENQFNQVVEEKSVLQELATRDPLTGIYNRRYLDAVLSRELARSKRERKQLAIMMLDLDHFKRVNDQYGHAAGDEVLKALAGLLKKGARESDLIFRYGGEEFVAVMPNMSADQALERVESWRKQLEKMSIVFADFEISITLSAGIAVFPDHGESPSQLLARADEMLYKSKQEGRNRITVCTLE